MATQIEIAEHLDMSDRNLREVLKKLAVQTTESIDTIRVAYIRHLRSLAANRGGEGQGGLMAARTREAEASAQLKELQIAEKAGQLVPVEEIKPRIESMIIAARTELLTLPDKCAAAIRALHGVDVDTVIIKELVHESLAHLASELPIGDGHIDRDSDQEVGAPADDDDNGVGR